MRNQVLQVNLQEKFGGGEVYTALLCRALDYLGVKTILFCHPKALFWNNLPLPDSCTRVPIKPGLLLAHLPLQRSWILNHGSLTAKQMGADLLERQKHKITY